MEPLIIYTNRNLSKVLLSSVILIIEILIWTVYFVSIPLFAADSFSIFVYVASPTLILVGFLIYFIFKKLSNSRIECYDKQILLFKGKKKYEINIEEIKNMEFYRVWAWHIGDFSENQHIGVGMIDIELENNVYRGIAIDREDYGQILDKYPDIFIPGEQKA